MDVCWQHCSWGWQAYFLLRILKSFLLPGLRPVRERASPGRRKPLNPARRRPPPRATQMPPDGPLPLPAQPLD